MIILGLVPFCPMPAIKHLLCNRNANFASICKGIFFALSVYSILYIPFTGANFCDEKMKDKT